MMAVRIVEMHRLLKSTGSLYLHCDPSASHYLKIILDAIFSAKNFRNEIVWQPRKSKAETIHSVYVRDFRTAMQNVEAGFRRFRRHAFPTNTRDADRSRTRWGHTDIRFWIWKPQLYKSTRSKTNFRGIPPRLPFGERDCVV